MAVCGCSQATQGRYSRMCWLQQQLVQQGRESGRLNDVYLKKPADANSMKPSNSTTK